MGDVRKIGNEYVIEFYARGLKYQQKAGSDKRRAEELLKTIEDKIAKGEMALIVRDVDYDIFFHDFLEFAKEEYPAKTYERFKALTGHFIEFLKSEESRLIKLSGITPHVIDHYRSQLIKGKIAPKIVNLTLFLLRDIFEYTRKLGLLNDNPTIHSSLVKIDAVKKIYLNQEEVAELLRKASRQLACIIEVILLTGLRMEELVNVKWADVDFNSRTLSVNLTKQGFRNATKREIPLQQRAVEILQALRSISGNSSFVFMDTKGNKREVKSLKEELSDLVVKNKVKKSITFHALRRTFTYELAQRKVPVLNIQKILGDSDVASTLISTSLISGRMDQSMS